LIPLVPLSLISNRQRLLREINRGGKKMKTKRIACITALCLLITAMSTSLAWAANPPQIAGGTAQGVSNCWAGVNTWDHSGNVAMGSTVHVYWNGTYPLNGTVMVSIYNPSGTLVASFGPLAESSSGIPTFVANASGSWYARLDGNPTYHVVTTFVASASVFVLPESVFGAIAAIGAGVAAIGTVSIYRKRKKN
jgi:hypothetical protein